MARPSPWRASRGCTRPTSCRSGHRSDWPTTTAARPRRSTSWLPRRPSTSFGTASEAAPMQPTRRMCRDRRRRRPLDERPGGVEIPARGSDRIEAAACPLLLHGRLAAADDYRGHIDKPDGDSGLPGAFVSGGGSALTASRLYHRDPRTVDAEAVRTCCGGAAIERHGRAPSSCSAAIHCAPTCRPLAFMWRKLGADSHLTRPRVVS